KAAFDWKIRKNFEKGLREEKGTQVIHFREAFHGRSGYTLSLTNTADTRKTKYFPKFTWPRITNPKILFPLDDENLEKVRGLEAQAVREIKDAMHNHPDDIAAIIIEPIQGEGGDNHFRAEFFGELRTIADENGVMLIFDEVQTGVGLTGEMWCFEHFGVQPDMIAFGKKTQVCGFLCSNRIAEVENHVFQEASRINSTWGGNLVDMVRFRKYLEIIVTENLIENARAVGTYFLGELAKIQGEFEGQITNVRGRGLMIAFDLPDGAKRTEFLNIAFENGLVALGCGQRSVRFRPALNLTRELVDEALETVRVALKRVFSASGHKASVCEAEEAKFEL
ncbi:MAG: aminotransferase class III-fold pyridoxal phosphate-dependent enzyme, partial [Nitrospinales bacterium]